MQLCKKPVHSYGRYKQAVQLYMPGSSSPPTAFVEASVEVGETLVDIGSAALDAVDQLATDYFTTGITISQTEDQHGVLEETTVGHSGTKITFIDSPDPSAPDTLQVTQPILSVSVMGQGISVEKTVKIPVVPEDAPETDTDDEKKKSTTGD